MVLRRRGLRRLAIAMLLTTILLGGGWLWVRDSSLVGVDRVTVTGVSGPTADAIRSALVDSARHMTTLHVSVSRLRGAVADFGVVRGLRVHADFPHGLRIQVLERPPVAVLGADGRRLAVTADGTILPGVEAPAHAPTIPLSHPQVGDRLKDGRALELLSVLGAAPTPLRALVARVYTGPGGLAVQLRNGPQLYLGDTSRLDAKWMAAARVLADPSSNGARYIDLRIPDRPVAAVPNAQALFQRAMAGVLPGGASSGTTGAGAGPAAAAASGSAGAGAAGSPAPGTAAPAPAGAASAPAPAAPDAARSAGAAGSAAGPTATPGGG